MFGPGATVIHGGPYALVLIAMIGGVLGAWALSRWLAAALVAIQADGERAGVLAARSDP